MFTKRSCRSDSLIVDQDDRLSFHCGLVFGFDGKFHNLLLPMEKYQNLNPVEIRVSGNF